MQHAAAVSKSALDPRRAQRHYHQLYEKLLEYGFKQQHVETVLKELPQVRVLGARQTYG